MKQFKVELVKLTAWTLIGLIVALAVIAGEARRLTKAADDPPSIALSSDAARSVSDGVLRLRQGCVILQTMGFTRCGHSVTRRIDAPAGVIGADFPQTQAYYSLWQVESFSPDQVTMTREIDLFCPMHKVLSVNEAGEIVLTHNVYGDGMAVDQTYGRSIGDFDEDTRRRLLLGLGFDTREDAEAWLAVH